MLLIDFFNGNLHRDHYRLQPYELWEIFISPRLVVPLLTRGGDHQRLGQGRLGGADGRDGSADVTNVTGACALRGLVQSWENGKTYNNIANISETPFLTERKNLFFIKTRANILWRKKQHFYKIASSPRRTCPVQSILVEKGDFLRKGVWEEEQIWVQIASTLLISQITCSN